MNESAAEARRAYMRQWAKNNRDKCNAYRKKYLKDHPEEAKAARKRYRDKHPDVIARQQQRYWERRALKEGGDNESGGTERIPASSVEISP